MHLAREVTLLSNHIPERDASAGKNARISGLDLRADAQLIELRIQEEKLMGFRWLHGRRMDEIFFF